MKPIYIRMQAFGSYQEECISFEKVEHGLFLITGDTGAGKTTIFDAITFALYGKTSGGRRDGKMMRSQYAPRDRKTEVEFKFIYHGEEYTIIRSPEQTNWKKKKDGDGREYFEQLATPLKPRAELIMPDGSAYPGKIKDINNKIEEIIGLSAEQFTQIAMLAQGDFMKLLHASSEERKEIFAKIFDTKLYELIEKEIAVRSKNMNIRLAENRKDIEKELGRVRCVEESLYFEEWNSDKYREKFSESDKESLLGLISDICKEAGKKQKEIESRKEEIEKKISDTDTRIQLANTVNKLFEDLKTWEEKGQQLEEKSQYINGLKERIKAAEKALEVKKDYDDLKRKEKEVSECRERTEKLAGWIEKNQENLEQLKERAQEAKKNYDSQSPQLYAEIRTVSESLPKYEELNNLIKTREMLDEKEKQLAGELSEILKEREETGTKQKQLSEETEKLREKAGNMEALEKELEIIANKKKDFSALVEHISKLESIEEELRVKGEAYDKAEKKEAERRQDYELVYHKFIDSQSAVIRAELREGEPCPVCGSIHHEHNFTDEHTEFGEIVDEKMLKKEKTKLDKAVSEKESAYKEKQEKISEEKSILGILNDGCSKLYGEDFIFEGSVRENIESDYNHICQELEEKKAVQKETEKQNKLIQKNEKSLKEIAEKYEKHSKDIDDKNEKINQLKIEKSGNTAGIGALEKQLVYADKIQAEQELRRKQDTLEELNRILSEGEQKYKTLEKEMNENTGKFSSETESLQRDEALLRLAEEKYSESLERQGFSSTEEFQAACLKKSEIERFQKEIENYGADLAVAHNNIQRLKEETEGKNVMDATQYENEKKTLNKLKAELDKETKVIFNIVSVNNDAYEKGCSLYQAREKMQKTAAVLNNLDNTANGKLSGKHINFQTYIQRRYFKQIIDRANKRLYKMSGNQFILQCRDVKNLGSQGQVGLDLDVYSIVNDQCRDIKTLSGGESFMAALSMALGMADIIQNGRGSIHIDTMFIDEGFGSLSEDTRNQAINILNELSEGKRLVGIISHVSELKSQVETKLLVSKTDRGSSTRWEM